MRRSGFKNRGKPLRRTGFKRKNKSRLKKNASNSELIAFNRIETQRLWAEAVKERDQNRCVMCQSRTNLHAHHWIVHAGASLFTRFILDNGVTLCNGCHIFKIHQDGSAEHVEKVRSYMYKFVSDERYEQIEQMRRKIVKFSLDDYERIQSELKEALEKYRKENERK